MEDSTNAMDKEKARFILHSFRPDGADVNDQDFAEALALAMENRELGEWLAGERAFDATFAMALASVELPENLRQDIIGCLAGERADFPQAEDSLDSKLVGAFSLIQPPARLRGEILTAMVRTVRAELPKKSVWRRVAMPLAAAAGVALALFVNQKQPAPDLVKNRPLPVEFVQASFIRTYESPHFALDEKREDHQALISSLKSRKLPCPCCLPHGLNKVKGIGCRELIINGKRGSLICFKDATNGVVHLVIFRREDVDGALPSKDHPSLGQAGRWATARWEHGENVFILIGVTDSSKLASLF